MADEEILGRSQPLVEEEHALRTRLDRLPVFVALGEADTVIPWTCSGVPGPTSVTAPAAPPPQYVAGPMLRQFFLDLLAKHGIDTKAASADTAQ